MDLIMFIKRLFEPSQEKLLKIKEEEKRRILTWLAKCYHQDGEGLLFLPATDARQMLASSGFIQILDGGKKDLPGRAEWCMISDKGLNHLGYPGR